MNPKQRIWFILFIVLSLIGTLITFFFHRDAPPIAALEIPQSTKDFFKKLGDLGHVKFDWIDSLDLGKFGNGSDYSADFEKLEDENFIIYYRTGDKEKKRAEKTLLYANEAIPRLEDFFGKYYFAKDAKNRKLPIYLAKSQNDFSKISQNVGGSTVDWAAGVTFNMFSSDGDKLCMGIVLNSMVQDGADADLRKVVFHEMAHYNHFQNMDLLKKIDFMDWEVEGLASFFADDWNSKIPSHVKIEDYSLLKNPRNYIDSYWMGFHAFGLASGMGNLKNILTESYTKSLKEAIPKVTQTSFETFDSKWRSYCNHKKHQ
jgi:hypothetical protein